MLGKYFENQLVSIYTCTKICWQYSLASIMTKEKRDNTVFPLFLRILTWEKAHAAAVTANKNKWRISRLIHWSTNNVPFIISSTRGSEMLRLNTSQHLTLMDSLQYMPPLWYILLRGATHEESKWLASAESSQLRKTCRFNMSWPHISLLMPEDISPISLIWWFDLHVRPDVEARGWGLKIAVRRCQTHADDLPQPWATRATWGETRQRSLALWWAPTRVASGIWHPNSTEAITAITTCGQRLREWHLQPWYWKSTLQIKGGCVSMILTFCQRCLLV